MANSPLNEMINDSLKQIKEFAGNDTVVGEPISLPGGTTVIPVSKVAMGFASGGQGNPSKLAGGAGTGVTVTPIAFLTVSPSGVAEILPIHLPTEADSVDKIASLIEKTPDIIEKIKGIFQSKKDKNED